MDNGLWDSLHRLLLKVDRLVFNTNGTEEIREEEDRQILKTWMTFYELCMGKSKGVWTLACSKVDTIGEYHNVQAHAMLTNRHIGYSNKAEDGYKNGTSRHLPCVWFNAYVNAIDTNKIVLEHRIRTEEKYRLSWDEKFSHVETEVGTPQHIFDWLNSNLTFTGYKNEGYISPSQPTSHHAK